MGSWPEALQGAEGFDPLFMRTREVCGNVAGSGEVCVDTAFAWRVGEEGVTLVEASRSRGFWGARVAEHRMGVSTSGGAARALGVGLCITYVLVSCGYVWPSKEWSGSSETRAGPTEGSLEAEVPALPPACGPAHLSAPPMRTPPCSRPCRAPPSLPLRPWPQAPPLHPGPAHGPAPSLCLRRVCVACRASGSARCRRSEQ